MTVTQLIERLKQMNGEAKVQVSVNKESSTESSTGMFLIAEAVNVFRPYFRGEFVEIVASNSDA